MGGILAIVLQILGIVNATVPLMKDAEQAFSGRKGSGRKKRKLVLEGSKALLEGTDLNETQKKTVLKEIGKTVDTVATVTKAINK